MTVWEWLGLSGSHADDGADAIREISRQLESLPSERARFLALFAFLLARVANVDAEISQAETREMERVVEQWGHLPAAQAALVVEIAKAQNRLFGSTQNFLAAREYRDLASDVEKRALLHCMFAVSAADEAISVAEEESIREVARELLISNPEYLAIRSAYREKRAVLAKGWPGRVP